MDKTTIKETINKTIIYKIGQGTPFTLKDISMMLPYVKYSTLKVNIKRMLDQGIIKKSKNGIYFFTYTKKSFKRSVT